MAHSTLPALMRAAMLAEVRVADAVADRVHYQSTDGSSELPHVWFTRSGHLAEVCLGGEGGVDEVAFDIEVIGESSTDALIDGLQEALKGMIGSDDILYVDIENHDDDYLFRSADDTADYMTALRVVIFI